MEESKRVGFEPSPFLNLSLIDIQIQIYASAQPTELWRLGIIFTYFENFCQVLTYFLPLITVYNLYYLQVLVRSFTSL